jgi:hypothetical protein
VQGYIESNPWQPIVYSILGIISLSRPRLLGALALKPLLAAGWPYAAHCAFGQNANTSLLGASPELVGEQFLCPRIPTFFFRRQEEANCPLCLPELVSDCDTSIA